LLLLANPSTLPPLLLRIPIRERKKKEEEVEVEAEAGIIGNTPLVFHQP